MALSRLAALLPMRWLSNVRLPQAQRCSHGANQRWRIGLDDDDLISLVEPLPAGSQAAGDDWHSLPDVGTAIDCSRAPMNQVASSVKVRERPPPTTPTPLVMTTTATVLTAKE